MTDNLPARLAEDGAYRLMADTSAEVSLPLPRDLVAALRGHVEQDTADMRDLIAQRGGITASSDVYALIRYLQATDELLAEYVRLLGVVRKRTLAPLLEEVLADAAGADAKGNPTKALTVPDAAGDVRVAPEFKNTHRIDATALVKPFAAMFADQHVDGVLAAAGSTSRPELHEERAQVGAAVAQAIVDALENIAELGKFEPQVSKVRAYADALARAGHDQAAGLVTAAIETSRDYQGIKVERKPAK